jgi:ATP-binding cassette subfamily B protein
LYPWRWVLGGVILCVLSSAVLELVPPLLIRRMVDEHIARARHDGLLMLALLYLGATAAVQGMGFLTNYLTAVAAQGALHGLRVRVFAHLQQLPMPYHDHTPLGDSISRCTADVETVDRLFSSGVLNVVTDLVRLVTVAVAMVALSPHLAVVSAVIVLPVALVTRVFQVRVRAAERANRHAVGVVNTRLQETLGGVEVIRAFACEAVFIKVFRGALRQMLMAFNRATVYSALYIPLMAILAATATAVLLWVGTRNALTAWGISLGTLTAFVLLLQRFFKPITDLGDEWQTVQSALSGAERLFQVLALAPETLPHCQAGTASGNGQAAIALRDVVFGYQPGRQVLRGLSMVVQRGEHVALVGRTGAGKSTVLHLVGGLYVPWAGSVQVLQADPYQLAEDERRHVVGIVPQVVHLFAGTVLANLTLDDLEVPYEAVVRAAVITGADRFIRALPQGYATPLSGSGHSGGVQLSAGQCQLLALTRALVWDPGILVLDEATSAVDSISDAAFRAALRTVSTRRALAVLTVAHRLATAREADRVVVLDEGCVVEAGTPQELERCGGRFAAWLELEAAGWDWAETHRRPRTLAP